MGYLSKSPYTLHVYVNDLKKAVPWRDDQNRFESSFTDTDHASSRSGMTLSFEETTEVIHQDELFVKDSSSRLQC